MRVPWSRVTGVDRRELAAKGLLESDLLPYAVTGRLESHSAPLEAHPARHGFLAMATAVVIAATVAIVPMLVLGTVSGHDFPFHLASWMDVARRWHHGTIYPQWAELANWGFGEPRFVFYPPGSWILGAALGSLLPWKIVPGLFVWLVLVGAGISMFLLAGESLSPREAILAAVLFAVNPYHLLLVYYRSDFAELLASALFPLLVWGVMRIAREGWRGVPMLAAVVAAVWLSNAPAAVIAVYSVVLLFVVAYATQRDRRLLLYGSAALAGGFGLAAFYILPAARERAWVQINQVLTDGFRPEQNFLFTRASSMMVNTGFNIKISCVMLLMGVLATVAAYYVAKSREIPGLHYALFVALGAMSIFMMFSLSRPVWLLTPELHFVQFPWRYAVPFGVAFSFLVGAAAGKSTKLATLAVGLFVFAGPLAKIVLAVKRPSSWNKAEISRLQQNIDNGIGYRGTPEYLPIGSTSRGSYETSGSKTAINSEGPDELSVATPNYDGETIHVQSDQPRRITLKLFDYPNWQVNLDGSRVNSKLRDSDGRIVVSVPSGEHVIHIFMQRGWDAKLGIAISVTSAMFLSGLTFLARRKENMTAAAQNRLEMDLPRRRCKLRFCRWGTKREAEFFAVQAFCWTSPVYKHDKEV
jgi:hypothetical protein